MFLTVYAITRFFHLFVKNTGLRHHQQHAVVRKRRGAPPESIKKKIEPFLWIGAKKRKALKTTIILAASNS